VTSREVFGTYLDHSRQGFALIRQLRLATNTNNGRVVRCARNQPIQRVGHNSLHVSVCLLLYKSGSSQWIMLVFAPLPSQHLTRTEKGTYRISIHLENVLVKSRVNPNDIPHLMVNLQLERAHRCVKVHAVEVLHEQDLRVSFAAIARSVRLGWLANFDHYNVSASSAFPTRLTSRWEGLNQ
jgi:hypothetical protein